MKKYWHLITLRLKETTNKEWLRIDNNVMSILRTALLYAKKGLKICDVLTNFEPRNPLSANTEIPYHLYSHQETL